MHKYFYIVFAQSLVRNKKKSRDISKREKEHTKKNICGRALRNFNTFTLNVDKVPAIPRKWFGTEFFLQRDR